MTDPIYEAAQRLRGLEIESLGTDELYSTILGSLLELSSSACGLACEVGEKTSVPIVRSVLSRANGGGSARVCEAVGSVELALQPSVQQALGTCRPVVVDITPNVLASADSLGQCAVCKPSSLIDIPLVVAGNPVALVRLTDRPGGFDEELFEELHPVVTAAGQCVAALLNEQRNRPSKVGSACDDPGATTARFMANEHAYSWESWWGGEGSLFFVSPSFEHITGYPAADLVADEGLIERLVHPEDKARVLAHYEQHRQLQRQDGLEFRIVTRDGRERWLEHSCQPVTNGEEAPVGLRASNRDITAIKVAEERLQASELLLNKTFESMSEAVLVLAADESAIIVNCNASARKLFSIGPCDLLDDKLGDLLAGPKAKQHVASALTSSENRENVVIDEVEMIGRDGRSLWTEHSVSWLTDASGQALGRVHLIRDVSERRITEGVQRALQLDIQLSADEWQATFDAIDSWVMVFGPDHCLHRVNAATTTALGDAGIALNDIDQLPDIEPWITVRNLVGLESDESRHRRHIFDESTGTAWDVALHSVHDLDVIVVRDVSQTVSLRDAVRRSETLAAMGELVGGVAHEVRNPVFGLSAVMEALQQKCGDNEEFGAYFQAMGDQLSRLTSLMDRLLTFGRASELEIEALSLPDLVTDIIGNNRDVSEGEQLVITTEFDQCVAPLNGDKHQLGVLLHNLISNAVAFAGSGGRVLVRCQDTYFDGAPWIDLWVEDSGPGFKPDDLHLAFDPFFSRRAGGTGLGLAIAGRVVASHGGVIEAKNHDEGGGSVHVRLPCSGPAAASADSAGSPASGL